jgi:signal transduction histidine kinase/ligand-binding sensor domain-containing protein
LKSIPKIIFFIVMPFVIASGGQSSDFLTINDGLTQNYIFDILQDSRGFIWLGTKEGLNRYDGYSVVAYRNDPYDTASLSSNTVTTIFEDRDGSIWTGTSSGGMNLFNRNTETFRRFVHSGDDSFSLSHDHVLCIAEGKNNTLWIGTQNGLNHFDIRTGKVRRYYSDPADRNSLSSNNIIDVLENNDTVWISTTKGLCYLVPGTDTIERIIDDWYPEMQNRGTTSLFRDSRNRLLVGGRRGLFVYSGKGFIPLFTANDSNNLFWISRVREDHDGNLWVASAKKIVTVSRDHNRITVIDSLIQERFSRGLWIDRSNVVWVGTSGLGALTMRPRQRQFAKKPGNFLGDLFRHEMDLINTYFKQRRIPYTVDLNFRGANFFSAVEEGADIVWFLTEHELFRINRNDWSLHSYSTAPKGGESGQSPPVSSVYRDRNNDLWVATVGGVYLFSRNDGSFSYHRLYTKSGYINDTLPPQTMINSSTYSDITAIFLDRNKILWCGTPELGLIRYDTHNRSVKRYSFNPASRNSLSSNHILSIQEDPHSPDSILWIGTEGGGLNRMNTVTERFSVLSTKNGLPNDVIYAILADDSLDFWLSTNNGLVRFDPKSYEMDTYDTQDGLQSNEFNRNEYYRTVNGTLYFGGIYGYNAFHPASIVRNTVPPPVVMTEFRLINSAVTGTDPSSVLKHSVTETDSIILHYSDNMFSFQFAALDFNAPNKNKYAYRLEGFNGDWIAANPSRIATYTNIDPGTYVFHVKASNSDGIWNEEGKKITLTVLPPFWMKWWFRGIFVLLFFSTGPTIYYFRVTQLKKERQRQQEISLLLIESQEAERKRIAQEMHDSLGQELLVIKNRAVMGLKTVSDDSKEKRQLEQISDGATNVLKLVRTLSHNLRPPELDRLGLTETIRSILSNGREASNMALHAELDVIDGMIKKEDEINLIRILQEALNNIEKHSGASVIDISLKCEQQHIALTIQDNGKGFAADTVKHGIGLAGMSERVRILHGAIAITSAPAEGTIISVTIPMYRTNE